MPSQKQGALQLHDSSALSELNAQLNDAQFGAEFPLSILARIPTAPTDPTTALIDAYPDLNVWLGADALVKELLSSGLKGPALLFELPSSAVPEEEGMSPVELVKEGEHLSIYTSLQNQHEAQEL